MAPILTVPVDALCVGTLLILATGSGRLIMGGWTDHLDWLAWIHNFATGLALLMLALFAVTLTGQLRLPALAVIGLLMGLASIIAFHRSQPHMFCPPTRSGVSDSERIWAGWALMLGAALLLFAYSPPTGEDELHYQIALPHLWALTGQLTMTPDNISCYLPLNVQLIYAALFVVRDALTVKLMSYVFGVIVAGCVYLFATQRLSMSRPYAWLSVCIFTAMPFTVSLSVVTSSDFVNLLFALAASKFVWNRWEKLTLRDGLLLGLWSGAALGTRMYARAWIGAIVLLLVLHRRWTVAMAQCIVAILVFSPWPIHNALLTGNPVFPGTLLWHGAPTDLYFFRESQKLADATRHLFWRLPVHLAALDYTWGLGPLCASLAPFAWFNTERRSDVRRLLFIVLLTGAIFYALFPPKGGARYYSAVYPLLALLAGIGAQTLRESLFPSLSQVIAIAIALSLTVPSSLFAMYFGFKRLPFFVGRQSWDAYLQENYTNEEQYDMMKFVNTHLPKGSRVIFLGTNFPPRFYYDPQVEMPGMYHFTPQAYNVTTSVFAAALQHEQIQYVLLTPRWFDHRPDNAWHRLEGAWLPPLDITIPAFAPPYFGRVYETPNALLYKVQSGEHL